jgi:DGC domain
MVELPKKKVGIIACSGEELPEGTVTRLAALRVLEQIHPLDTVTICLPLFLAGGEGDRAFARFYPTIAIDGCDQRCAARATELYSGKPAASVVVTTLIEENSLERPQGARQLNEAGLQAVDLTAQRISGLVEELLEKKWSRRTGEFMPIKTVSQEQAVDQQESVEATCSCGSGLPIRTVMVEGKPVTIVALPLILEQFYEAGKQASEITAQELLDVVKIYQPIPGEAETRYAQALLYEYSAYCDEKDSAK